MSREMTQALLNTTSYIELQILPVYLRVEWIYRIFRNCWDMAPCRNADAPRRDEDQVSQNHKLG